MFLACQTDCILNSTKKLIGQERLLERQRQITNLHTKQLATVQQQLSQITPLLTSNYQLGSRSGHTT